MKKIIIILICILFLSGISVAGEGNTGHSSGAHHNQIFDLKVIKILVYHGDFMAYAPVFEYLGFNAEESAILTSTYLIMIVIILLCLFLSRELKIIPQRNAQIIAESFYELIKNFLDSLMDSRKSGRYVSFIGTLGLFIFLGNLMGMIPFIAQTTNNYHTPLALALIVFIYYNYEGAREHGIIKYVLNFAGPKLDVPWWLVWLKYLVKILIFFIEVISSIFRPISLTIRLTANMFSGHTLLGVILGLVAFAVPVVIMGLEVIPVVVQTLIFTILASIYIAFAIAEEH